MDSQAIISFIAAVVLFAFGVIGITRPESPFKRKKPEPKRTVLATDELARKAINAAVNAAVDEAEAKAAATAKLTAGADPEGAVAAELNRE